SNPPGPDEDVGLVTFTGYDQPPSTTSPLEAPSVPPDTIVCGHGGNVPYYGCAFAPNDSGSGLHNVPIGAVFTSGAAGPYLVPGMSQIDISIQGGGSYGPQTASVKPILPAPTVLGVKIGNGTATAVLDNLGPLSATQDVT